MRPAWDGAGIPPARIFEVTGMKSFGGYLLAVMVLLGVLHASALGWENLDKAVMERGVIRIGIGYNTPPMNYLSDSGEHEGFDVDLAKALAGKMGCSYTITKVNNKTRITALAGGEVDMVLSNMNHTMSRAKHIDFSDTYLLDGKRILARKGAFHGLKDFVGRRIAVCQGSNAQQAVAEALKKLGDPNPRVLSFQNDSECFLALKMGRVDGYTNDTVILAGISGGDPDFEAVGEVYSPTYYGIGLPQNQSAWRYRVNAALRELLLDGTYAAVYGKWFGKNGRYPLPPGSGDLPVWAD